MGKKTIAVIVGLVLFPFSLLAQDTVAIGDSCYLYQTTDSIGTSSYGELAYGNWWPSVQRFSVARGTKIYGIATTTEYDPAMPDSILWVALWIKEGDRLVCVDSATAVRNRRSFEFNVRVAEYTSSHYGFVEPPQFYYEVVPCLEYYFDTPFCATDTFYVSFLYHTSTDFFMYCRLTDGYRGHFVAYVYKNPWQTDWLYSPTDLNILPVPIWGILFPIVRPYCARPEVPTVTVEGGEAYFSWCGDSTQYELSVARRGVPADSGLLVATADTACSLTALDSGVWYQARLRRSCYLYDSLWWSDWSLPVPFYLGSVNPDSLGIAEVDCPGLALEVSPNPTDGRVTVACGEPMELLEVYDTKGSLLRRATPASDRATLDLAALPAGTYLLRVTTPQAVASRKLVRY